MISSYSDSCFVDSNTCPSTANTGCSHTKDVTIECSKLALANNMSSIENLLLLAFNTTYANTVTNDSCIDGSATGTSIFLIVYDINVWLVSEGTVRLYRNGVTSSSYYYGIVQIYINNRWGNICHDFYYSQYEADVICHQLGYTGASNYYRAGTL